MKSMNNKLNFFIDKIEKSENEDKDWIIRGVASYGGDIDSDGEVLDVDGMDCTEFMSRGYFNYNHSKEPRYKMLGKPTKVWIEKNEDGSKNLMVEGKLFKDNPISQDIWNNAKILEKEGDGRSYGFSVEGLALQRDDLNPLKVLKSKINDIAICERPKNARSLMSIVKGESEMYKEDEFEEDEDEEKEEKAIDSQAIEPLRKESVEGKLKKYNKILDKTRKKEKKLRKSEIFTEIFTKFTSNNEVVDVDTANNIFNFFEEVQKSLNMSEINADVIAKAKDILGLASKEDEVTKGNEFSGSDSEFGDKRPSDGAYEQMLSDGVSMMKGEMKEDSDKEEVVKACSEKYPKLNKSDLEKAYDKAYKDKFKDKEEKKEKMEKSETETKELTKAEILAAKKAELEKAEAEIKAIEDELQAEKENSISKALTDIGGKEAISELVKAETKEITDKLEKSEELNKSLAESNDLLKKQLEQHGELLKGLTDKFDQLSSFNPGSKAPKTTSFLAKGESTEASKGEPTYLSISNHAQKQEIIKSIESMAVNPEDGADKFVKAAADAQFGSISREVQKALENKNIIVTP